MASSINNNIKIENTPTRVVERRPKTRRESPVLPDERPNPGSGISLVQHHKDFGHLIGTSPQHALVLSSAESSRNPFFYAGCAHVYERAPGAGGGPTDNIQEVLYTTSNLLQTTSSAQLPVILISRTVLQRDDADAVEAAEWSKLRPPPTMPMPAGVIAYQGSTGAGGALYCAQGSLHPETSGLFYMPRGKPPQALVTGYYGRDFNSVYDVAWARDGALWFTDPCHGFEQDFRKRPQLPCHVYRFNPASGSLRVVADGLQRPTGICFSPDEQTVYITDTDAVHSDGNQDSTRAATIYAFDVLQRGDSDFLANKRVFAYALHGVPIGIQCDAAGNVYAACGDGVEVWNVGGTLLGVIEVPGGVTSFCFSQEGEMFLCAEQRLWWVHLKSRTEASRWGAAAVPMTVDPGDNFI